MQTKLADFIKDTPQGHEADAILRACVHCGFCLATCPTYQLLGDELDSPRGRIYLIKQMLEGEPVTRSTQLHLDRCLTCLACETTCPSGVRYGRLADIGRGLLEAKVQRPWWQGMQRAALRFLLLRRPLFTALLRSGQFMRPLLPRFLRRTVPARQSAGAWPSTAHSRRMLVLEGCVQPALAPNINAAAARVLDRLGVALVAAPEAGCCGAIDQHLGKHDAALAHVRRNIDAWWPHIEQGAEAVVVTASGCGVLVKDYGHLLRDDPAYAQKAARVVALARDVSEVVLAEKDRLLPLLRRQVQTRGPLAFHSPCSLQHGQKIKGVVEQLLSAAGYPLTTVPDGHLCCGSAGTYSILQPVLSQHLLANKVRALESGAPVAIATANIGCLTHIQTGTPLPVRHWIEFIDQVLAGR
jgi:glycolate oxidase iron-sulfur subunit